MTAAASLSPALDVLCAGEALWDLRAPEGVGFAAAAALGFAPGGAAVNVALRLAGMGLRAGLAAAVGDDVLGEALIARVAAAGVDTGFTRRAPMRTGVVFVEHTAAGKRALSYRSEGEAQPVFDRALGTRALLLTGVIPLDEQRASWSEAAARARAEGALVVMDLNARPRSWRGRRAAAAEIESIGVADVVKGSAEDLAILGLGVDDVRSRMRTGAVLVITDGAAAARAIGAFGELMQQPGAALDGIDALGAGDAFTAGILAARLNTGTSDDDAASWALALLKGHEAATALLDARRRSRSSTTDR